MTPEEWNACTDPYQLRDYLFDYGQLFGAGKIGTPRITFRKARLIHDGLMRLAWGKLPDDIRRRVERGEEIADGSYNPIPDYRELFSVTSAIKHNGDFVSEEQQCQVMRDIVGDFTQKAPGEFSERAIQLAQVIYEEPVPSLEECGRCLGRGGEDWYPEDDPTNSGLSGGIWMNCSECHGEGYVSNSILDSSRLLMLADILEEDGTDSAIPGDLRAKRDRFRGYWVIDMILGKG